ncbi:MAG: hypothetical protein WA791_07350, partial [Rhodomicrobium sp.]
ARGARRIPGSSARTPVKNVEADLGMQATSKCGRLMCRTRLAVVFNDPISSLDGVPMFQVSCTNLAR